MSEQQSFASCLRVLWAHFYGLVLLICMLAKQTEVTLTKTVKKKTLFEMNLLFCYTQLSLGTMATIRGQREKYFVKRLKQLSMYLSGQKGALSRGVHCSEGADCSLSADFSEAIFFFAVVKTKVITEGVSMLKPF